MGEGEERKRLQGDFEDAVEREIKVGELVLWDFDEQICAWIWLGMKFISIIEVCCLFYYDNKPYILVCEYVLLISKLLIDKTVTWKRQSHFGIWNYFN